MNISIPIDYILDSNSISEADKFCSQISQQSPTHVFLTVLWEAYQYRPIVAYIDNFMHSQGIPTTWVINSYVKSGHGWENLLNQSVFLDFCLWRIYNEIVVKQKCGNNPAWNPDATRFLFLTGKPEKVNRVRLLYKLEQANLLQHCDYSFFMNQMTLAQAKSLVPELTQIEFEKFVQTHSGKSPDAIKILEQGSSFHYSGIPYNPEIYTNALFKLVPETNMHFSPAFITEKTWLSIVNHCPFVIAGDCNSCGYLESIGIHRFDKIFNVSTYDDHIRVEDRLNKIILHVQSWINKEFNREQVQYMVEQNFKQFINLALAEKQKFESATGHNIDLVIDTQDPSIKF